MSEQPNDFLEDWKNKNQKNQEMYEQILADLNNDEKYKPFFEKYNVNSLKEFKESYARYKTDCIVAADYIQKRALNKMLEYADLARECLWNIQGFKLIQLQAAWRANEVTIPGIKFCHDFHYWQLHIAECTFIEPITKNEVDRYISYLDQEQSKDIFNFEMMNTYALFETIRDEYGKEESRIDPYFTYMLDYLDNEPFLKPDIKGVYEEKYYDAYFTKGRLERESMPVITDHKPSISFYDKEQMKNFVLKFGKEEMLKYKEIHHNLGHLFGGWPYYENAIQTLKDAGDNWPIAYHAEWRQALIHSALQYRKKLVMQQLPNAYKDYLFRLQNNIAQIPPKNMQDEDNEDTNWYKELCLTQLKQGMEFLGETDAFDFE